jgi:hypothetical protein
MNKVLENFENHTQKLNHILTDEKQKVYEAFNIKLAHNVAKYEIPDVLENIMNEILASLCNYFDTFNKSTIESMSRTIDTQSTAIAAAGFAVASVSLGALAFHISATATKAGTGFFNVLQGYSTGAFTLSAKGTSLLIGGSMGVVVTILGTGYKAYQYHHTKRNAKIVLASMITMRNHLKGWAINDNSNSNKKLISSILEEYRSRMGDVLKAMERSADKDTKDLMIKVKKIKDTIKALPQLTK